MQYNIVSKLLRKYANSDYYFRPIFEPVCLSIRRGATRLPLEGFSWNLISEYFSKNLSRNFKFQ